MGFGALQYDKEVILAAVRQDGCAFSCALEWLKEDEEVILAAVIQQGFALLWASERFKYDKEVVLAAVMQKERPFYLAPSG